MAEALQSPLPDDDHGAPVAVTLPWSLGVLSGSAIIAQSERTLWSAHATAQAQRAGSVSPPPRRTNVIERYGSIDAQLGGDLDASGLDRRPGPSHPSEAYFRTEAGIRERSEEQSTETLASLEERGLLPPIERLTENDPPRRNRSGGSSEPAVASSSRDPPPFLPPRQASPVPVSRVRSSLEDIGRRFIDRLVPAAPDSVAQLPHEQDAHKERSPNTGASPFAGLLRRRRSSSTETVISSPTSNDVHRSSGFRGRGSEDAEPDADPNVPDDDWAATFRQNVLRFDGDPTLDYSQRAAVVSPSPSTRSQPRPRESIFHEQLPEARPSPSRDDKDNDRNRLPSAQAFLGHRRLLSAPTVATIPEDNGEGSSSSNVPSPAARHRRRVVNRSASEGVGSSQRPPLKLQLEETLTAARSAREDRESRNSLTEQSPLGTPYEGTALAHRRASLEALEANAVAPAGSRYAENEPLPVAEWRAAPPRLPVRIDFAYPGRRPEEHQPHGDAVAPAEPHLAENEPPGQPRSPRSSVALDLAQGEERPDAGADQVGASVEATGVSLGSFTNFSRPREPGQLTRLEGDTDATIDEIEKRYGRLDSGAGDKEEGV